MSSYATVAEYRIDTGDQASENESVEAALSQQSAKLRAHLRISEDEELSSDALELCRLLVTDASRKQLVKPDIPGIDGAGVSQGSFSANSFSASFTAQSVTGSAYFDRDTLRALRRLLGRSQRAGNVWVGIDPGDAS